MKKTIGLAIGIMLVVQSFAQSRLFTIEQFSFIDTAEKPFNLQQLKGKTLFIDCWFPACPPCRQEMPFAQLLQQRLQKTRLDTNIVFVTICFKQSVAEWKNALQQLAMPQAIHLYSHASTYEIALSGGNYPTYRVFNKAGYLDNYMSSRPSEIFEVDFLLFAVDNGLLLKDATLLFKQEVKNALYNSHTSKNSLVNKFIQLYKPFKDEFEREIIKLRSY